MVNWETGRKKILQVSFETKMGRKMGEDKFYQNQWARVENGELGNRGRGVVDSAKL